MTTTTKPTVEEQLAKAEAEAQRLQQLKAERDAARKIAEAKATEEWQAARRARADGELWESYQAADKDFRDAVRRCFDGEVEGDAILTAYVQRRAAFLQWAVGRTGCGASLKGFVQANPATNPTGSFDAALEAALGELVTRRAKQADEQRLADLAACAAAAFKD